MLFRSFLFAFYTIQVIIACIENSNIQKELAEYNIVNTEETINPTVSDLISKKNALQQEIASYEESSKEEIETFLKSFCKDGISYDLSANFIKAQQELREHTERFFTPECYQTTQYYRDITATEGQDVVVKNGVFTEYKQKAYSFKTLESISYENTCFVKCDKDYAKVYLFAYDDRGKKDKVYMAELQKESENWKISSYKILL